MLFQSQQFGVVEMGALEIQPQLQFFWGVAKQLRDFENSFWHEWSPGRLTRIRGRYDQRFRPMAGWHLFPLLVGCHFLTVFFQREQFRVVVIHPAVLQP